MKQQKRTTIYDIARKLNLNASSVSRALAGASNVSDATKKLVLDTARELNYKHNKLAADLRKGQSQTIGVVVPKINQNFFSNVIAGIEAITYGNGYQLIICQSNESFDKEVECINTLIQQHVSCIIVSISADFKNGNHLQSVLDHNIKLIQFDRVDDTIDTIKVLNDNFIASKEAVTHLLKKGYQRIALLEGPQNLNIFRERKEGYLAALAENGIAISPELMKPNAWTKELSTKATQELLEMAQPPDAIFASTSDFAALGVLEAASKKGIHVPNDLGICGYSNEAFTEITHPSITTVDQYSMEMGRTIANLYFSEKNTAATKDPASSTIVISPKLIIRESTNK